MKKFLIALFTFTFLYSCNNEVTTDTPSMGLFEEYLFKLASDEFEGRAPGTNGGLMTKNYISDQYKDMGLNMFGDSYLMPVKLAEVTLNTNMSEFNLTYEGKKIDLVADKQFVYWTKRQVNDVELKPSDLIFVGYGVNAPEYDWLDYSDIDVTGKTLVLLINDPGFELKDPNLFKGMAMTYYGRWGYKYEEAARRGASGVLIIHETAPAAYGWEVVENSNTGPQLDLSIENKNLDRIELEGWITKDVAEMIFSKYNKTYDQMKAYALSDDFKPFELDGFQLSAKIKNDIRYAESHNVVGFVEGSTKPDEYLMVMAHWDHLGISPNGEIYNGAVDNATGVAMVMSLAEYFSKRNTERSIIFIGLTAEESGLLGSAYFAENMPFNASQMIAGLNFDAYFAFGKAKDIQIVGYGASELEDLMSISAQKKNKYLSPDWQPEKGLFYRSDHISFAKIGIPVLYTDPGIDMIDGGRNKGIELVNGYYLGGCYHKTCDELGNDWDYAGIEQDLEIFADFLLNLANSTDTYPNWYEGNEFKAIRDKSLSQ